MSEQQNKKTQTALIKLGHAIAKTPPAGKYITRSDLRSNRNEDGKRTRLK